MALATTIDDYAAAVCTAKRLVGLVCSVYSM